MDAQNREKFSLFVVPEECKSLVKGSRIISRIKAKILPNDSFVYSYRGSTTEEKIKFLNRHPEQKSKCVILQDATNSVLKQKIPNPINFIGKFLDFIEVIITNFSLDMVVICEIPPVLDKHDTRGFNNAINDYFGSKSGFEMLNINSKFLKTIGSYFGTKNHFNDNHGVALLRNCLRSFVCLATFQESI